MTSNARSRRRRARRNLPVRNHIINSRQHRQIFLKPDKTVPGVEPNQAHHSSGGTDARVDPEGPTWAHTVAARGPTAIIIFQLIFILFYSITNLLPLSLLKIYRHRYFLIFIAWACSMESKSTLLLDKRSSIVSVLVYLREWVNWWIRLLKM